MSRLVTVKLLGELGRCFTRQVEVYIENPAQAVRALCANFPGFEQFLADSDDRGIVYRVLIDGDPVGIDETMLDFPVGRSLVIAPVMHGACGGFFKILLGVALIAVSFFIPGSAVVFGSKLSSIVGILGASLVVGGVYQLLSPVPKMPSLLRKAPTTGQFRRRDTPRSQAGTAPQVEPVGSTHTSGSFLFDRAAELGDTGLPVPILYGEHFVFDPVVIFSSLNVNSFRYDIQF